MTRNPPCGRSTLPMDEKPGDFLNIDELSAYPTIPKSTPCKLVREGEAPCQKVGRRWRLRKVTIDRWSGEPHGDATIRQDGRFGRTEGAPEERGPRKVRFKDGGNEQAEPLADQQRQKTRGWPPTIGKHRAPMARHIGRISEWMDELVRLFPVHPDQQGIEDLGVDRPTPRRGPP